MILSKDWREFLELLNSRGADYADLPRAEGLTVHSRRGVRSSRRTTLAVVRTLTPRQLFLAVVRLSSEPTPLFRLRFFRCWRGGFLLCRSGSFGLRLFLRRMLRLGRDFL